MKQDFVYPKYNGESILNIPSTILSLFDIPPLKPTLPEDYYKNIFGLEKILFLFVDGLGFNLFQNKCLKYNFFRKLSDKGVVSKITSIFPSTTSAALNTYNSGLSPLEHGLPEWTVYFKELDCVLESLPFVPVFPDDLQKTLNPPEDILFGQETIYQKLNQKNIPSFAFLYKSYSDSFYNKKAYFGSHIVSYNSITDLMVSLRKKFLETQGRAYFLLYWSAFDFSSHNFGPESEEAAAEISLFSYMFQEEFINKIDNDTASNIALFLSADHGQIGVNPKNTIYLEQIEGLVENFQVDEDGKLIPPTGGARDIFLHIKEEKLNQTLELLRRELVDVAEVLETKVAIRDGLFGSGNIHPKFLDRIGNVLILAHKNNTIWYHFDPKEDFKFFGYHGGLSSDEMLVPFVSVKLSELK